MGSGDGDSGGDSGRWALALSAWAEAVSGMGQSPENGEDGIKQGQCRCDRGLIHVAPGQGNRQVGTDLLGRASRDSVVVQPILSYTPGAFGNVARH